jgi:hypothetical protein
MSAAVVQETKTNKSVDYPFFFIFDITADYQYSNACWYRTAEKAQYFHLDTNF